MYIESKTRRWLDPGLMRTGMGALCAMALFACGDPDGPGRQPPINMATAAVTGEDDPSDFLYVGDNVDSNIKRWNADTGQCLGTFVRPDGGGPPNPIYRSPRGMVISRGKLFAVAQNANLPLTGEVHRFDREAGAFVDVLTPSCIAGACLTPFAPRGAALLDHLPGISDDILYVGDAADTTDFLSMQTRPGRVARINAQTGQVLADLSTLPVTEGPLFPDPNPTGRKRAGQASQRARGVVQGPDGKLYVSVIHVSGQGGHVIRLDPSAVPSAAQYVIENPVNNDTGVAADLTGLHRPEVLAFGPDGRLYVTSFRRVAGTLDDHDKILVYDCPAGAACVRDNGATIHLDLDSTPNNLRTFAQGMVFGPGGYLFAFVTTNSSSLQAEVRYYDVTTKRHGVLGACPVSSPPVLGEALRSPFYGTFGKSDPATLAYPSRPSRLPPPSMGPLVP